METPYLDRYGSVDALKRGLATCKGHLTRTFETVERDIEVAKNTTPSSDRARRLMELRITMMARFEPVEAILMELGDVEPKNAGAYEDALGSFNTRVCELRGRVEIEVDRQETASAGPTPDPTAPPRTGSSQTTYKPDQSLKPYTLTMDHRPLELRKWQKLFRSYYSSSKFAAAPIDVQQAQFESCLDSTLGERVSAKAQRDTPVFGDNDSMMSFLEEIFLDIYPLYVRRIHYFQAECKPGQSFFDFANHIDRLGNEAELDKMSKDDHDVMRYLSAKGVDPKLLRKLMASELGTKADVMRIARNYGRQNANLACKEGKSVNNISSNVQRQRGSCNSSRAHGKGRNQLSNSQGRSTSPQSCDRCGHRGCRRNECKGKNATCTNCGKRGHLAKVCRGQSLQRGHSESRGRSKTHDQQRHRTSLVFAHKISANGKAHYIKAADPTPRVKLTFASSKSGTFIFNAMPDTGATCSIMAMDVAQRHGILINQRVSLSLTAANGTPMPCEGTAKVTVTNCGTEVSINFVMTSGISNDILIGWRDLIALQVIPKSFPAKMTCSKLCCQTIRGSISSATNISINLEEEIFNQFPIVFNSTSLPVMSGKPMHIELTEHSRPTRVLTARQVPLHLQTAAAIELKQALDSGIIVPVTEPTDWISPAFFVPKADGRARLVTDFTGLNRFVRRPVHPFPSSADILKGIEARSKVFAKLDARSGYFQIPLDYESSLLTTFLLPSGRYRYTRAPMGLSASSDEFCFRSDEALRGLPGVLKIVDDVLIQAADEPELRERLITVLEACKSHGITLSRDKAAIGEEFKFAGFIVSASGCRPDPAKLKAITAFPRPKDTTGVRSFLGLAAQLGHFIPDLAHVTDPLRQLLRKGVAFTWLPDHEKSFEETKQILTSTPLVTHHFDPAKPAKLLTDASRINGLGFALMQGDNLVQCGSRSLSPAETRYAVIELECLAIGWAVCACRHYLLCSHFEVITDHRLLVGSFSKPLSDIDNPRIMRL